MTAGNGVRVGVVNVMGRVFLANIDDPFTIAAREVARLKAEGAQIVFVDIHAEATSEKIAMGWYLDGQATAVVGTHTHVQTADARVLPGGTAYLTDVGMTGPHDGVIGMEKVGGDRQVPHRPAGPLRDGHRRSAAARRAHHRRPGDRPGDGHRAAQSVGRRARRDGAGAGRPGRRRDARRRPALRRPPARRRCRCAGSSRSASSPPRCAICVESRFPEIWVEGELSNARVWNTGHLYFTLKDGRAQVKGVMFRSALRLLSFKPEDGLHVVARGRLSVYDPSGEYQLVGEHMEPHGPGRAAAGLSSS